jgi:uncharacterized protein
MEQRVSISSKIGRLRGVLVRPDGVSGRLPVVIMLHGWRGISDSVRAKTMASELAEFGIASLRFDFQGHGRSDGDISKFSPLRGAADLAAVIRWLKSKRFIDPARIGMVAVSIGGSVGILALARTNDFKAGVLISARSDFHSASDDLYSFMTDPMRDRSHKRLRGRKRITNTLMTKHGRIIDFYKEAESIHIPLLLIHGGKDASVSPEQSKRLAKAAPQASLVIIKLGDHQMRKYIRTIVRRTVAFLRNHLV